MAVTTASGRRSEGSSTTGSLPEPSGRLGAHGWSGKRVREDVRDGVAVAAFSLTTSTGVAVAIFWLVRLAG